MLLHINVSFCVIKGFIPDEQAQKKALKAFALVPARVMKC